MEGELRSFKTKYETLVADDADSNVLCTFSYFLKKKHESRKNCSIIRSKTIFAVAILGYGRLWGMKGIKAHERILCFNNKNENKKKLCVFLSQIPF